MGTHSAIPETSKLFASENMKASLDILGQSTPLIGNQFLVVVSI